MPKRKTHLAVAQQHGRRAIRELRHMTADSALYWVLAHRRRVAEFRRAVKGTRVAKPLDRLIELIRAEASPLKRPATRKSVRARRRQPRRRVSRFPSPPFLIG